MEQLGSIIDSAWAELVCGVKNRRHGFHLPMLSTCEGGGGPDGRVVVLRRVIPSERLILCHTDRRSGKVEQIARQPEVLWVFYDFKRRLQLRVRATAHVLLEGPLFEEAWSRCTVDSRRCYLAPNPPGRPSDGPSANLPEALLEGRPSQEESEQGRSNFALVHTLARSIEWLHLAAGGHRRARFVHRDSDGWSGEWLEP